MDEPPFEFLLTPVLNDGERAYLMLQMARTAYETWCLRGGIVPDWDSLPLRDKETWGQVTRQSLRVMMSVMAEIRKALP